MTEDNRKRLTALVAAGMRLNAASRLVKEATIDVAASGLFSAEMREEVQKIADEIDTIVKRLELAIERIPS